MKHRILSRICLILGLVSLVFGPASADTTIQPQTVTSTLQVTDPGKVTTAEPGPVVIEATGQAVFNGGTGVVLKPGFWAKPGASFRATPDLNLGGLTNLLDGDFDGLPDQWEILHFLDTTSQNGNGDPDHDGISNAAEYRAGSDPRVADGPAVTLPNDVRVILKTPSGRYQKVGTDWSINQVPVTP